MKNINNEEAQIGVCGCCGDKKLIYAPDCVCICGIIEEGDIVRPMTPIEFDDVFGSIEKVEDEE